MASSSRRGQPAWAPPAPGGEETVLRLFNSLTREKEVFVPQKGRQVTWYNCGPTVYDASHMGHARTYLSFDILRRVLQDYFGYNVFFVMNITDIDDKIIKRARQNHLYQEYLAKGHGLDKVLEDCSLVMQYFGGVVSATTDPDKRAMQERLFTTMKGCVAGLEGALAAGHGDQVAALQKELLTEGKDIIADWLDSTLGSSVTDNSIFSALPRHWEEEFHKDMSDLNVLPADCLTRVSEYVPEIVKYIEKIIERGYAYESNGSVYFDVGKFDASPCHHYAKLVPEAVGDRAALQEGEGDLVVGGGGEKRADNHFALWKKSKPGEPSWESGWGLGRPGWHIECSVMASAVLGSEMDIHSGGYDLKFPHHDNELAQSEAYFDHDCWTRYFLHSGHLTIAGCKMSKSLKNFITIQEVLKKHSARQVRLAFLLHSWKDTLDYSENTMELVRGYERTVNEFFLSVKHLLRSGDTAGVAAFAKWGEGELAMQARLQQAQGAVHAAMCDNIDTRRVLETVRELVVGTNAYIERQRVEPGVNRQLIKAVATYITRIFDIFGMVSTEEALGFPTGGGQGGADLETLVMPYLNSLAEFRGNVRGMAREVKAGNILAECDTLRDVVLPDLGVRLEDKEGEPTVIKLVDREDLRREREEKVAAEERRRLEKEAKKAKAAAEAAARAEAARLPPDQMFRRETEKYSAWDGQGLPTHAKDGAEIPKAQQKKLQKLWQAQEKKYNDYLKSQEQ